MLQQGAIHISAVARPQAFGFTTIADVWMEVDSDRILDVARQLAAFDNVSYVACSIGQTDVSIQVVAKDTAGIYHFVTEVVRKIQGVRKTTTSIVPIILKDVYQWRIPEATTPEAAAASAMEIKSHSGGSNVWRKVSGTAAASSQGHAAWRELKVQVLG